MSKSLISKNKLKSETEKPEPLSFISLIKLLFKFLTSELGLYLFFGGVTTVLSIFSYWLFLDVFHWNNIVSVVISWIIVVLVAFITNHLYVFCSEEGWIKSGLLFFQSRLMTLLFEIVFMYIVVDLLTDPETRGSIYPIVMRTISTTLVIILNYILSKWFVFNSKKTTRKI